MGLVRGCGISCTPCRRRGRGVGYLLCLNQVTHPPATSSRLDPLIPRSTVTLTRWEASLLSIPLVMTAVEWVIGGSGTMETRVRMRWKLVSLAFYFLSFPRTPDFPSVLVRFLQRFRLRHGDAHVKPPERSYRSLWPAWTLNPLSPLPPHAWPGHTILHLVVPVRFLATPWLYGRASCSLRLPPFCSGHFSSLFISRSLCCMTLSFGLSLTRSTR